MSKISVIVPVYNTEKYLQRCVDSILAQTFTDFELLLVNDGSTDGSGAICDEYAQKDSRVRVFHKENGGASSARNLGLDNAKGEWITFCDSDDYVYTCWLSNYEVDNNGQKFDLICQGVECDKKLQDNDNSHVYSFDFAGHIQEGLLLLFEYNIIGYVWNKCFKREIINSNQLDFCLEYNLREDEEFVLRYLNCCETMISVSKVGYYYFVPNWTAKYVTKNGYDLWLSLYKSAVDLYKDSHNAVIDSYINNLTIKLYDSFLELAYKERLNRISDYRKTVGEKIFKTRMFFVLKYIILFDRMGVFSAFLLGLYLKLKWQRYQ